MANLVMRASEFSPLRIALPDETLADTIWARNSRHESKKIKWNRRLRIMLKAVCIVMMIISIFCNDHDER